MACKAVAAARLLLLLLPLLWVAMAWLALVGKP